MVKKQNIASLEKRLLRCVDAWSAGTEPWQRSSRLVFSRLQERGLRAVVFGGALRSLVRAPKRHLRPRDIDIVFAGSDVDSVSRVFSDLAVRRNRFGGLRIEGLCIDFDLWPVEETYLLKRWGVHQPGFEHLPSTTFLNIEGIAVALWAEQGHRRVFTKNHEFFHAMLNRTLELNAEENPFPSLCVVRSLVLAYSEGFKLGPRLASYIAMHGRTLGAAEMDRDQRKHYGHMRISSAALQHWIKHVSRFAEKGSDEAVALPAITQPSLFSPTYDERNESWA